MRNRGLIRISRIIVRELSAVARLLRRRYYFMFRRKYVLDMVSRRKGRCERHGCCDLSLLSGFRRCVDSEDRTRCLKWDTLPLACRLYPFDEKDKIPATRPYCSFHWGESDEMHRAERHPDASVSRSSECTSHLCVHRRRQVPSHDSRRFHLCSNGEAGGNSKPGEVTMDLPHECFHALPAMIAGDVVLGV